MPVGSRMLLYNISTFSIVGSSLLDGYINWYKKLFLCYRPSFEPMRSHALEDLVRSDAEESNWIVTLVMSPTRTRTMEESPTRIKTLLLIEN